MYSNAPAPTAKKVSACVGGGSVGMTVSRLAIGRLPPEKDELCDQHRRHDGQSHDEDHRIGGPRPRKISRDENEMLASIRKAQ